MTRIALLADVHADLPALVDALAAADALGCERVLCAGDLVDYGRYPEETLALFAARKIPTVRGNHDRWAADEEAVRRRPFDLGAPPSPELLGYLQGQQFLSELPPRLDLRIDGVRLAVRHASPKSDMLGVVPELMSGPEVRRMLAAVEADILIVGHTHQAFVLRAAGGGLILNPGALLRDPSEPGLTTHVYEPLSQTFVERPFSGGTFGMLELPSQRFTLHRASDGTEVEVPRIKAREGRG